MEQVVFVENKSLTASEPAIKDRKWKKPLDQDGIYDPSVELELWQFSRLRYIDQIDYLLWQIDSEISKQGIANKDYPAFQLVSVVRREQTEPDGTSLVLEMNRAEINPRILGASGRHNLRYKKYARVHGRILYGQRKSYQNGSKTIDYIRWHGQSYGMDSAVARPKIFKLLICMLSDMDAKYSCLRPVIDYYETSQTLGVQNPKKFRGGIGC